MPCCCSVLFGLVPRCPCDEKDFAGFLAVNYFCEYLSMYHRVQSTQLISASTYISLKQFKLSLSESKSFERLQAFKPTQVLPWTSNIGEGWSFQHLPHREFLLLVLNWVFIPYGRAELKCFNMQLYCSLVLPIRLLSRCWHSRSIIFFSQNHCG